MGYTGISTEFDSLEEPVLVMQIPRQEIEPFEKPETVQTISDSFASAVKSIMAGNFFLSLILATALQYLWGMINALQLIVLGVFFDLLMPANTEVV